MIKKQFAVNFGIFFLCLFASSRAESDSIHLFILSGQSNMDRLNYKESFLPAVEAKYSAENVIVVKDAHGGQPLRRWYFDWEPAEGVPVIDNHANSGWYSRLKEKRGIEPVYSKDGAELIPQGIFYEILMEKVFMALGDIKPITITFIWMQGESDAAKHYAVYKESLLGLVQQLRDDLNFKNINVVIGRISDSKLENHGWVEIRRIQQELGESGSRWGWVSTDDLNGEANGTHFTDSGYVELGLRFAEKAFELNEKNSQTTGSVAKIITKHPVEFNGQNLYFMDDQAYLIKVYNANGKLTYKINHSGKGTLNLTGFPNFNVFSILTIHSR